ncbi:hypothetical protein Hamer_G013168 [Homarus americanus]|uniref:Uncharacterized protein n=1 Tax=Homarus americanus TaxID=6706 RepID=A0A8J5K306_HOMAM|nr:hypothetical protein Hamer_G013168 [Homarus americanus]
MGVDISLLPPCHSSLLHIRCYNYQAAVWRRSLEFYHHLTRTDSTWLGSRSKETGVALDTSGDDAAGPGVNSRR